MASVFEFDGKTVDVTNENDLQSLIQVCLSTDPAIVEGTFRVSISHTKVGPLNQGLVLTPTSQADQIDCRWIAHRLVTILMLLRPNGFEAEYRKKGFQIICQVQSCPDATTNRNRRSIADQLVKRGLSQQSANELVNATSRMPAVQEAESE